MIKNMVKENILNLMEMNLMDISKKMFFKEAAFTNIKMEIYMWDILKMATEKEKANLPGLMVMFMKVNGFTDIWKDKVH